MKVEEFCDVIEAGLKVTYHPNQNGRWTAAFADCEVKEGGCLRGTYGEGVTANLAIWHYIEKIVGKRLVKGAYTDDRQEFNVPAVLEFDFK